MSNFIPIMEAPEGSLHLARWNEGKSFYFGSLEITGKSWRLLEGPPQPGAERSVLAKGNDKATTPEDWIRILARLSPELGRPVWHRPRRPRRKSLS